MGPNLSGLGSNDPLIFKEESRPYVLQNIVNFKSNVWVNNTDKYPGCQYKLNFEPVDVKCVSINCQDGKLKDEFEKRKYNIIL